MNTSTPEAATPFGLSDKEREALEAYARCGCIKLTVRELGITERALEYRMTRARIKLGVRNSFIAALTWDRLLRPVRTA